MKLQYYEYNNFLQTSYVASSWREWSSKIDWQPRYVVVGLLSIYMKNINLKFENNFYYNNGNVIIFENKNDLIKFKLAINT